LDILDVSNNTLHKLGCNNNQLTRLSLGDAIGSNTYHFDCTNNPDLICIEVNDPAYASTTWTAANENIDAGVTFSVVCGYDDWSVVDTTFTFIGSWNGHPYYASDFTATWVAADLFLDAYYDAHLATVTSSEEQEFIWNNLPTTQNYWIGLTDQVTEGTWEWVTGETVEYTNWHSGEPNNSGNEDYTVMWNPGTWNDARATHIAKFVVELTRMVQAQNLDVGDEEDMQHLITHTPNITWHYYETNNQPQTTYQVQVSTNSDYSSADMWDSGEVSSTDTSVTYAGEMLEDGETYYLRVKVGADNYYSQWSTLSFRMNSTIFMEDLSFDPDLGETNGVYTEGFPTVNSLPDDGEGDSIFVYYMLSDNAGFSPLVDSALVYLDPNLAGVEAVWQPTVDALDNQQYWIKAKGYDGYEYGNESNTYSFAINSENDAPTGFTLTYPLRDGEITTTLPTFLWQASTDPDPLDTVRYMLQFGSTIINLQTFDADTMTSYQITEAIDDNTDYYWRVFAEDLNGAVTVSSGGYYNFRVNTANDDPGVFSLISPDSGSVVSNLPQLLVWSPTTDLDGDNIVFDVYLDGTSIGMTDHNYFYVDDLMEDESYTWSVSATDNNDGVTQTETWSFTVNTENMSPSSFALLSPEPDTVFNTQIITFEWESSIDSDPLDTVSYILDIESDTTNYHFEFIPPSNGGGTPHGESILAYYPFNGNTNDESGNNHHGNIEGGVSLTDDKDGNPSSAYYFDGVEGSRIFVGSTIALANSSHTISLYAKAESATYTGSSHLFGHGTPSGSSGLHSRFQENGTIHYGFWGNDVGFNNINYGSTLWHNYVYTYDYETNTRKIYVDGTLLTEAYGSNDGPYVGSGNFVIGSQVDGYGGNMDPWLGVIDEVVVWDVALNGDEVQSLLTGTESNDIVSFMSGGFNDNSIYHWSVSAEDMNGAVTENIGGQRMFIINVENDPPSAVTLITPTENSIEVDLSPIYYWTSANDPDPLDMVQYKLFISHDHTFGSTEPIVTDSNAFNYDILNTVLDDNSDYYWKVIAFDDDGAETGSETLQFWTDAFPEPPMNFATIVPENESEGLATEVVFVWNGTDDPDPLEEIHYQLVYATDWDDSSTYVYSELLQDTTLILTLADNNQYYWIVNALDTDEFSVGSNNNTPNTMVIGTLSIDAEMIPDVFALHQNYPNPFNPVTTLRYDLPEDAMVNITIYDMIGRVVKTMVNSQQNAGFKSVRWDATNNAGSPVSAGLYLYMIQAGEFRQTKKMVLLK